MITYLLRNIPRPLWRRVQQRATKQGITIREAILRLLETYAAEEKER